MPRRFPSGATPPEPRPARRCAPRRPLLDLGATTVPLTLTTGHTLAIEPSVLHRAESWWPGLGELPVEWAAIEHTFDLVIESTRFDIRLDDLEPAAVPEAVAGPPTDDEESVESWMTLLAPYGIDHVEKERITPTSALTEEQLLVARVTIEEYPSAMCSAVTEGDWFEWLDRIDDEAAAMGEVVRWLTWEIFADARLGVECPLDAEEGSLFLVRMLDVHPAFRGHALGAKLIVHALWTLRRSGSDLAVLLAMPMEGFFRPRRPTAPGAPARQDDESALDRSPEALRRLVRYYQRIGFRRARQQPGSCEAVAMYRQFGCYGFPVKGLPTLR